ncbi:DUF2808 domain-containing protein [Funiculus sociatus GB2-A5]|jgi:hypothetical protein|uniref:DUF2808 domain-containing protein n=1 Tax=Funiculus sociatus GB2-A5 TaxID=2933946 RepID=A0ABV0JM78_9CYAN|nr:MULTISPECIES: DUF2808 domain-containing protein [unclassified Trichocoleus]MBD1904035.1 DUF2808 domain-containing protein [Trichocoleus sp. FACHB-832]MBD2062806.1 DUF2808 domain-containing protein [Trichocoleus sp. FACHB-6]
MRLSFLFGSTLAVAASIWGIAHPSAVAIRLADGTVSFDKPPRLVNASTTFETVNVPGATYYFTVSLPENAGEPLQRIAIAQNQGFDDIRFQLKDSVAFEGTPERKGEKLRLKAVTKDNKTGTITVTFDPPVSPGKTVTIGLDPVRNPWTSGVYLFRVTAFPAGEKAYGLDLGVGRLHFYPSF